MTKIRAFVQKHQRALLLLLVILLALPVFALREGFVRGDVFSYMVLGQNICAGQGYITPSESYIFESSLRGPVYSLLLSASFCALGSSIATALLVTQVVFLLSVVVAYLLASTLYEQHTGLLFAILVVTSSYLVGLNAHMEIDPVMAFFMLLSLYLAVVSFTRASASLGLLAGITMALAFLTKEIALLWLPLPAYLFLSVPDWRQWRNLLPFAGYVAGFAGTAGAWWIYFYLETGEIFMAARASLMSFVSNALPWLLVFAVLIGASIYGAYRLHGKLSQSEWGGRFLSIGARGAVWGLWLVCTTVLTLALAQQSAWFYSVAEIPLRLSGFKEWWDLRIIPYQPLFSYWLLLPGLFILVARLVAKRSAGDKVVVWSILALTPQALTLSMPGQYIQVERYGIVFFWLGYLLLASVGVFLLRQLDRALSGESRSVFPLSAIALAGLFVGGLCAAWAIPEAHAYWDIRPRYAFNNDAVQSVAEWLEDNVPKGSVIASSAQYVDAWSFYSGGAYQAHRWYSFNKKDRTDRVWPMVPYTQLTLASDKLEFHDVRFDDSAIPSLGYIQHGKTRFVQQGTVAESANTSYTSISREALVETFHDLGIEYLIVSSTSSEDRYMLTILPDFFLEHPAFQKRFSTGWMEGSDQYEITVFQIDLSQLYDFEYPVIVTANTWPILIEDAASLLHEEFDLYDLIQALDGGPIALRPASPTNAREYERIAHAYLTHGEPDLAAFEYHLALQEAPEQVEAIHEAALRLVEDDPDRRGPWLLLGDVHCRRGEYEQAVGVYTQALALPGGEDKVSSAIHQGLGLAYLALNQNGQASKHLALGVEHNLFQATASRLPQLVAGVNVLLAEGNLADAKALISAYTAVSSGEDEPGDDRAVAVDLISRWPEIDTGASQAEMTGVRIYVVDQTPHLAIFAHPPSELQITVDLSAGAELQLAPFLAPEVWQVGKGDGVEFKIYVQDDSARTKVYSRYVDPKNVASQRAWIEDRVDLSAWSGQTVTLSFVTTPGPNGDERYDWAAWGELCIVQPATYDQVDRPEEGGMENAELWQIPVSEENDP